MNNIHIRYVCLGISITTPDKNTNNSINSINSKLNDHRIHYIHSKS